MNNLTAEFFRDIEKIQNHSEDIEEALERLVESELFSKMSIFYGRNWFKLCSAANNRGRYINAFDEKSYKEVLRTSLFLSIASILTEDWSELREKDNHCEEYGYRFDCETFAALRKMVFHEIQRDLLDGALLWNSSVLQEEQWPAEIEELTEADQEAFADEDVNVEEDALNSILLAQIRGMVNEEEWDIIIASHGDGPELAEKYGVTESAIRSRRQWVIERVKHELES